MDGKRCFHITVIDMKAALQEKDVALEEKDATIQSLRERMDKLEASVKTNRTVEETFGAPNAEVCC